MLFNIEVPSMLFQPFVENAIKHGLLNLERKGTLIISFSMENSELIKTDDDGVGRTKAEELKSFMHKNYTSRGMEIINERIAVINYIENTKITVEIIDKWTKENEPEGTKVIIRIPI